MVFRDELSGFLRGLDKQGHESDRAFYLEAWNGTGSFVYDRIGRGTVYIDSCVVSIFGGIQPGPLSRYLRAATVGEGDDGMISRFQLAAYPDNEAEWRNVDRWPDTAAKNRASEVIRWLDAFDPAAIDATRDRDDEIPLLRFADDAQEFFNEWRTDLEVGKLRASQGSVCLESHLAKFRSLMPSLALLFHLIDVADGHTSEGETVSLQAAMLATAWCDYLEAHARRIYQAAFKGDVEPALRLAERIKATLPNPFSVRQVVRKGWSGLDSTESVERAVNVLEELGWVKRVEVPTGPQGGRPTEEVQITPRLLGGES